MKDQSRTKKVLIQELVSLRSRIFDPERLDALQKTENFRELIENINDTFYELDGQGMIQYSSPSIERITGYTQTETIGRPITDFLDTEDAMKAIKNVQKVMSGSIAPNEYRVRHKSGETCWVRVFSSPVWKGDQVVGIRGILSDITELKRIEEALRESEDRFKKIFEEAYLGIVITSPSFAFVKANPAFCRMMGTYSGDVFGTSINK